MRNARGFMDDCRSKGYPDERIRIIASMRPEPLRSEVLQILDAEAQAPKGAAAPPAGHEDVGLTTSEQAAVRADAAAPVIEPGGTASAAVEPERATPHPDVEALRQELAAARGDRDMIAGDLRKAASELTSLQAHFDREAADLKKRADQEMWVVRRRLRRLQKVVMLGGAAAAVVVTFLIYEAIGKSRENSRLSNELAVATRHARGVDALANQTQMPPLPLHSARKVAKVLARSHHRHSRHQPPLAVHSTGKVTKALAQSHHRHRRHQPPLTVQRKPQSRPFQAT